MEQLLDKLVEGTCGEASPVLKLIQKLNWMSDDVHIWDEDAQTESYQQPPQLLVPEEKSIEIHPGSHIGNGSQMIDVSTSIKGPNVLQTLFLTEPQFFQLVLQDVGQKEDCLSSRAMFQDNILPESAAESSRNIEEDHHDDCTPSSGPDFLMEIQNPNWETAAYSQMSKKLQEISGSETSHPTHTCLLQDFSSFFLESLLSEKSKYEEQSGADFLDPRDPLTVAKSLMAEGKVLESVPFLESAVKKDVAAKARETWTLLALAQYLVQNDAQAISACKQYLKLPRLSEDYSSGNLVLLLLATCLLNEGDTMACQAVIFQWAIGYLRLEEETVRDCLQAAETSNCNASDRNWNYGLLSIFEHCMESRGMHSDGTLNWAMAILYFSTDDFVKAGRCFERVLVQNATSPSVLNQIGACLHNSRQYEKAICLYDQALRALPEFPRALYNKATTLHVLGETEKGLHLIETALARQHSVAVQPSDQFWYLAARLVPRLPAKLPDQHRRRTKLMSSILRRDLKEFKDNLPGYCERQSDSEAALK